MGSKDGTSRDALSVAQHVFELMGSDRWDDLLDLVHPDFLGNFRNGGLIEGVDGLKTYVEVTLPEVAMHQKLAADFEAIDEERIVVTGRIRWSMPEGGFSDLDAAWALRVRDGLLWRFRTTGAAVTAREIALRDLWTEEAPPPAA